MKKTLLVGLAVASISATATVAFAGWTAGTGINGSLHDINIVGGGYKADPQGRTCVFCHTPHNAIKADALVPLWNHAQTGKVESMNPYTWIAPANLKTTVAIATDPLVGPSRLCMACHDGDTAVDAHGSAGSENTGVTPMRHGVGYKADYRDGLGNLATRYITDLTVTHPIGFDYDKIQQARGSAEIIPKESGFIKNRIPEETAATWNTQYGSATRQAAGWTDKKIEDTLYGGNIMTCASCHEVHNTLNVTDDNKSYNYFLYARQEGSAICLSCHVK